MMMNGIDFKNLMFYMGEYTKKVGRVAARPVLLTYFVMMDSRTPKSDKLALATAIAYVVLPIDLISAKRFPIIGWLDEVMSLSVAYSKVQSHVTREMERKADDLLDKWLPEYTNYELVNSMRETILRSIKIRWQIWRRGVILMKDNATIEDSQDNGNGEEERLYQQLEADQYKKYPYKQTDIGEGMGLVNQVICGYWKPRYLLDHDAKTAVEFMSASETLMNVTDEDIDWKSIKELPQDVMARIECHSFHFPGYIYDYEDGIAKVRWEVNPDGMYYRDEDGFGMTDDDEINLEGAIDRKGKVVKKFSLEQ